MGRLRYAVRLLGEFWQFARDNKAYWIVPLILVLLVVALLVVAGQGSLPWIYTLF
ncbi:MAG: hypothetical protein JXQ29_14635 [Planctomycetes bacterium]|nr:hypothetical protein [Planctomycetota bacterium]